MTDNDITEELARHRDKFKKLLELSTVPLHALKVGANVKVAYAKGGTAHEGRMRFVGTAKNAFDGSNVIYLFEGTRTRKGIKTTHLLWVSPADPDFWVQPT